MMTTTTTMTMTMTTTGGPGSREVMMEHAAIAFVVEPVGFSLLERLARPARRLGLVLERVRSGMMARREPVP
jgi:hypothetical protein